MMKKKIVFLLIVCCLIGAPTFASMTVKLVGHGLGTTGGGEFFFEAYGIPGHSDGEIITTFCLETRQYISYNSWYDVTISTEAISGCNNNGPQGPTGGDALDPMTAYLFYNYSQGTLANWDNDNASADGLQKAIWYIEDERTTLPLGKATTFWKDANNAVNGANPTWQGLGKVGVMNLYNQICGNECQDQLVVIPAPAAILLGGIGAGLVGWLRRRRML